MIIFRESNGDRELFVNVVADQLLFEARDKGVGTDLQIVALIFSAFKSNTVYETFVIDRYCIAVLNCTALNRNHTAISVLQTLQLSFNCLIRRSIETVLRFYTLVLTELNFRLNCYCDRIFDALVVTDLLDIQFRTGNDLQVMLLDSFSICRVYNVIDSIIVEHTLSVILLYKFKRCLTLTETRDLKTILILIKGLLKRVLKFFRGCFQ